MEGVVWCGLLHSAATCTTQKEVDDQMNDQMKTPAVFDERMIRAHQAAVCETYKLKIKLRKDVV